MVELYVNQPTPPTNAQDLFSARIRDHLQRQRALVVRHLIEPKLNVNASDHVHISLLRSPTMIFSVHNNHPGIYPRVLYTSEDVLNLTHASPDLSSIKLVSDMCASAILVVRHLSDRVTTDQILNWIDSDAEVYRCETCGQHQVRRMNWFQLVRRIVI